MRNGDISDSTSLIGLSQRATRTSGMEVRSSFLPTVTMGSGSLRMSMVIRGLRRDLMLACDLSGKERRPESTIIVLVNLGRSGIGECVQTWFNETPLMRTQTEQAKSTNQKCNFSTSSSLSLRPSLSPQLVCLTTNNLQRGSARLAVHLSVFVGLDPTTKMRESWSVGQREKM